MSNFKRLFFVALVAMSCVSESVYANGFSMNLSISAVGGGMPCPPPQMPCPPPQMPCPPVQAPCPPPQHAGMPMPMPMGGGFVGGGYVRVQAGGYRPCRRRGGCRQVRCNPCGGRMKRCFGRGRC